MLPPSTFICYSSSAVACSSPIFAFVLFVLHHDKINLISHVLHRVGYISFRPIPTVKYSCSDLQTHIVLRTYYYLCISRVLSMPSVLSPWLRHCRHYVSRLVAIGHCPLPPQTVVAALPFTSGSSCIRVLLFCAVIDDFAVAAVAVITAADTPPHRRVCAQGL